MARIQYKVIYIYMIKFNVFEAYLHFNYSFLIWFYMQVYFSLPCTFQAETSALERDKYEKQVDIN